MRGATVLFALLTAWPCAAAVSEQTRDSAGSLWGDLRTKREALPGVRQEFTVSRTVKTQSGPQASKRSLTIELSHSLWREHPVSGASNRWRIFDGNDLFVFEEGNDEFVRTKRRPKEETPLPALYSDGEWAKARELVRRACGLSGIDHQCVILDVPVKAGTVQSVVVNRPQSPDSKMRVLADLETGLILSVTRIEVVANERNPYEIDTVFVLKTMNYGAVAGAPVFRLPSTLKEVKELSKWDAARIKKKFAGKPAPELVVRDLQGSPITLADLKGKTVLLDFWTTWCPPCRADAPALDRLYKRYGGRDLEIVGISVSEERAVVEKYLAEHPHSYSIVLTTENEMPPSYQVDGLPTYIVIGPDGLVVSAAEGDQGFGELRRLLKKAGLEVD